MKLQDAEAESFQAAVSNPARPRLHEVWWWFAIGAILRVGFFLFGKSNGGDAFARAALTAGWLRHPALRLNFEPWLPLHFWLMAGMSILLRDPALGTRALSLVLGITSLWALWSLTKEVYGSIPAVIALEIFALYSLHIGYSTASSSEVPYLFFMLVGLLTFSVNRRTGSLVSLCISAILLGVAAGIRYEAWVCIFAVCVVIILIPGDSRRGLRGFRDLFLFGCISALWPVFWMAYQWAVFSRPLYGISMNYTWVPKQMALVHRSMLYRFALPPGVLLITFTPIVLAAAVYGLWIGLRRVRGREFAIVVAIMALAFGAQIARGGLLPMARYTITLGTFACTAAGYGLERLIRLRSWIRPLHARVAFGVLLALNLLAIVALAEIPNAFQDKIAAVSPALPFPRHIELVGHYLKGHLTPTDSLVIDDYNVESNIVAAAVGLPLISGDRAFLASERPISSLPQYLKQRQPDYIIYSDHGVLRNAVPLPPGCSSMPTLIGRMDASCVFQDDIYRVYRVSYHPGGGALVNR
ncbi:MAG: ArnT family glycosyltransferase [Candidatus Acidiferrales bacterium]